MQHSVGGHYGVIASGRSLPGQNKDSRIIALGAVGSPEALKRHSILSQGDIYSGLTQLGKKTTIPPSPEEAVLERVPNPQVGTRYAVRFTAPEFTSLCPMTGQPDFAHLVIDYIPGGWLVESKSLKLYLMSFRNHGAFHEDCTVSIARRLSELLAPEWLRIGGYWYPRGGIPIDVFFQTGPVPADVWIPDQGVPPYRGRG
jgi:7-cyano-7-deazaguanine reductase